MATTVNTDTIPYVTADEAQTLLHTEFDRFMALLESLSSDDWTQPTACVEWNVRDVVAHQAGSYASGTGYREMIRQYAVIPKKGQLPEDTVNERQLRQREKARPEDLMAELRHVGPIAIQKWGHSFRLIRPIALPHPSGIKLSMRHLMWVIHSRDTWMHRLDICRATDRAFHQTAEHDGRIVALVMRDVGQVLNDRLEGRGVAFRLEGESGGEWHVGEGQPEATVEMDVLDFNVYASGRFTVDEALARATLSGDAELAEHALRRTQALY